MNAEVDRWMAGCGVDRWIDEGMDGWKDGWRDEWGVDGQMVESMDGW